MNQKNKIIPLDCKILDLIQHDMPFVNRPWQAMAKRLNIEEEFLLGRLNFLKKKGIIRRICVTFNPRKLGFSSTLVAIKTSKKNIDKAVSLINSYGEVTHNYRRNAKYNLWFTIIAKNRKRVLEIVNQIKKDKNIGEVLELPAIKLFKIGVNFSISKKA